MSEHRTARPFVFFFLMLPYGISSGICTILIPFVVTKAGMPVAVAGSIVAIGLLPNVGRVFLAPLVDVTLSLARWYKIGLIACIGTVILLAIMPIREDTVGIVTAMVFLSQVGANLLAVPIGGLMAHTVDEREKGRAGGWYQAALLGGAGFGGGAGVWFATHLSTPVAGIILAATMFACGAATLAFLPDPSPLAAGQRLGARFREMGRDLGNLLRSPEGRLVAILVMSPIAIGAATNLWSAIAPYWHATPDVVAFSTGVVNGLAAGIGCVAGGWIADRIGRWIAFFGSGLMMAIVAVVMASAAPTPAVFGSGILFYAFSQGLQYAAFSAVLLHVTGRGAAATKYAFLGSLGNLPVSYMTAFDGWAHDRFGAAGMLVAEALVGAVCVVVGVAALWWVQVRISRRRPIATASA